MAQKRHYEVTRTREKDGFSHIFPVRVHSPKDFLGAVISNSPARPGKFYTLPNGETISYRIISREEYAKKMNKSQRAPIVEPQQIETAPAPFVEPEDTPLEEGLNSYVEDTRPALVVRRDSLCGDNFYTGATYHDDSVIGSLDFTNPFLNKLQFQSFKLRAEAAGYKVVVQPDEIAANDEAFLSEGASAKVETVGATVALFKAPALSARQKRRSARRLFGNVRRG